MVNTSINSTLINKVDELSHTEADLAVRLGTLEPSEDGERSFEL